MRRERAFVDVVLLVSLVRVEKAKLVRCSMLNTKCLTGDREVLVQDFGWWPSNDRNIFTACFNRLMARV